MTPKQQQYNLEIQVYTLDVLFRDQKGHINMTQDRRFCATVIQNFTDPAKPGFCCKTGEQKALFRKDASSMDDLVGDSVLELRSSDNLLLPNDSITTISNEELRLSPSCAYSYFPASQKQLIQFLELYHEFLKRFGIPSNYESSPAFHSH